MNFLWKIALQNAYNKRETFQIWYNWFVLLVMDSHFMHRPLAIICKAFGHRTDRKRCWHDQMNWRSHCKICKFRLIRDHHGWREFKVTDYSTARQSKDEVLFPSNQEWTWVASSSQSGPHHSNLNDNPFLIADHTGQNINQDLLPSPNIEEPLQEKVAR